MNCFVFVFICKIDVRNLNIGRSLLVYDNVCNSVINHKMHEIEYIGRFLIGYKRLSQIVYCI